MRTYRVFDTQEDARTFKKFLTQLAWAGYVDVSWGRNGSDTELDGKWVVYFTDPSLEK